MKNNIIYILIILTFIVSLGFYKGIWQKVESYDEDSINLFLDTDSIRTRGDFVYYRTRTNYNKEDFVCWVKSDCKNNLTSVLGCRNYSKKLKQTFIIILIQMRCNLLPVQVRCFHITKKLAN